MSDEIEPASIEEIESIPGLKTALEILGFANRTAHENGKCVIEFRKTESGSMNIQEITEHVVALEGDLDADTE